MKPTDRLPRRPVVIPLLLAVGLASAGGAGLSAQQADGVPAQRNSFHFSVAVGGSSVGASCASCENDFFSDRINGFSGHLQLGGAFTPRFVVAAEFLGWIGFEEAFDSRIAALSVVVLSHPAEGTPFFIKSGLGMLRAIAEDEVFVLQTDALAAQLGVGYDADLGGRLRLTPQVTWVRTFFGSSWVNDFPLDETVFPSMIQLHVGLTLY